MDLAKPPGGPGPGWLWWLAVAQGVVILALLIALVILALTPHICVWR